MITAIIVLLIILVAVLIAAVWRLYRRVAYLEVAISYLVEDVIKLYGNS